MEAINIEDLRERARLRLPKIFFDYIDGGAFSETTLAANCRSFDRFRLHQRVLTGGVEPALATRFLGSSHDLPFMLGPIGFLGLYSGQGEIRAARAAHAAGIPFCLSTFSITSLARLRAVTQGPLHFQLYVMKDRGFTQALLDVAREVSVDALYLTVDTAVTSVRERDERNGFRSLTRLTPGLVGSMVRRPRWCADILRHGVPTVGAVADRPEFGQGILQQAANLSRGIDSTVSWKDFAWLRERWPGRLVLKGVLTADDAARARDAGADAIIVSNHGGRQLDGARSTLSALPEIRSAVGGDMDVMLDGGIRRGADVIKALALGASGVLLGRAYAFGLAAGGEAGVSRAIAILRDEIRIALILMGVESVDFVKSRGKGLLSREEMTSG